MSSIPTLDSQILMHRPCCFDFQIRVETLSPEVNTKKTMLDEIKDEMLSRVKTFFGNESFSKLHNSFIIVRIILKLSLIHSHYSHLRIIHIEF
jgi:hypothetical protein